jgi:hypothetical protein
LGVNKIQVQGKLLTTLASFSFGSAFSLPFPKSWPPYLGFPLNKSSQPCLPSMVQFSYFIVRMFPSRRKSTLLNWWIFFSTHLHAVFSVLISFLFLSHSWSFSYYHFNAMIISKNLLDFLGRQITTLEKNFEGWYYVLAFISSAISGTNWIH